MNENDFLWKKFVSTFKNEKKKSFDENQIEDFFLDEMLFWFQKAK